VGNDLIPRKTFAAILLCFFLSGAAGLIYQVAWGKALGLVFGHTVYAIATVIAVFMGGLAVGSALLGRWSEHHPRPVALYGWIELMIAATGALSLLGLAGVRALYVGAYPLAAGSPAALLGLRFVGSAIVLFIPTFLMGGTLPILVRGLTRHSAELGERVSRLYWVNTLGAVAGTLAAGFLLLPALGLRQTIAIAVGMNVVAGVVALRLRQAPESPPRSALANPPDSGAPGLSRFLVVSFALVGATAIAYEVAWSRLLATMLGSSTYAFTLMLATFLVGIVLGSALFEAWARRGGEITLGTFATTQTLTGLAALAFLILFQKIPYVMPPILRATGESFFGLVLAQFVTSALAMLPAAVIFGFNFPVVTVLLARHREGTPHYGEAVGRAYAANTLGAILGATAAGFWLIPHLGSFRVVGWTAAANLLLALLLQLWRSPQRRVMLVANAVLLGLVSTAAARNTFYDRSLANFSVVMYWDLYESPLTLDELAATTDLVFLEDGLNATITVARTEDYISLRTNGKVDASNNDKITQLLLGHLGASLHPAPKRALVIGFGSGMTVSALARYPGIERIDCVEIEPAVIHAAPYLEELNRGVLRDPRVHIILDDGRNFLLTTRERYDLIVSEPSNPWIAGVAGLFTDEFYREVRSRLAPGGMLVQWIQAYSLYPEDLKMVLATLVPHFPQVSVWRGESQDLILLGQTEARQISLDRLRALWESGGIRADYEEMGIRQPEGLAAFHLLDDADLRRLVAGAPRNTDDHTRLEYRAPRSLLAKGLGDRNTEMVEQERRDPLPQVLRVDGAQAMLAAAAETLLNLEEYKKAGAVLSSLPQEPPRHALALLRGRWQLESSRLSDARDSFQLALQLDTSSLAAAQGLAETARRTLNYDQAELLLRQILGRDPGFRPALESMALVARARENWTAAAEWQRLRIAADPAPDAESYALLGEYLLRGGESAAAERVLQQSLEIDPYAHAAHRQLAELYLREAQPESALPHLEFLVRYHPTSDSSTYVSLANVYASLGRLREAEEAMAKGLRLFPTSRQLRSPSAGE